MKIRYSYKEYKGHPEATEISRFRGMAFTFYCIAIGFGVFFAVVAMIDDFSSTWYIAVPTILLCIAGFIYLTTYYDTVTERKIAKAIAEKNQIEQKKIAEYYICLEVFELDSYKSGRCEKCLSPSNRLRECIVKDRDGEGFIFICNSCITRYKQNKR